MFLRAVFVFLFLSTAPAWAFSSDPATLDWDDLLPKMGKIESPHLQLPQMQQWDVESLADLMWFEANDKYQDDPTIAQDMADLTEQLTDQGVDIKKAVRDYETYRDEIAKRNRAVVAELDGRTTRLPGYALPLEFEQGEVREFLLVPYLGACIHTPPPPPNQIVFVRVAQPFKMEGLYEPVWVTGRMKTGQVEKNLSYVDGAAKIETGYTMEGVKIEPYLDKSQ